MKAEFLKLAGVKTEKQFYAKYPDEQSFFKAHPEAKKMIKKAQSGTVLSGMTDYLQSMGSVPNMQNVMQGQMQSPGVNAGMFPGNNPNVGANYGSYAPGNYNSWDIDNDGIPDIGQSAQTTPLNNLVPSTQSSDTNSPSFGESLNKIVPIAGELLGGYRNLRAGRRAKKEAQKWAKVTGVQADAAESVDIDDYRQYAESAQRKRDAMMPVITGEQFFPTQGVGTNVLAKNGVRLKGGGEIQNTYAPGTIYDNLEYEPLELTNQVKAYRYGGGLIKAENGFANWTNTLGGGGSGFSGEGPAGATPWGAIGGLGSSLAGNLTGNDGGGQIGGTIGGAAGAMFGPAGMAIGKTIGTLAGGLLDTNDRDQRKAEALTKNNIGRMMASQYKGNLHGQFGQFLKYGGNISEMEEGGELNTHWGGYAEPMSYNPYLPDEGETVMFRGNSHEEYDGQGNTGIGVSFGNSDEANVEVERGEPAVKLKDGGGSDSLVVYGNLQIPKYGVEILGDKKAEGKKFKNYISDLSKVEEKQNKLVEKSTEDLNTLDVKTSFDKLKLSTLQANIQGANMKLKSIADKKIKAADLQNAINDTAEEYGLVADDLAKGKIKTDKKGMKLREAMFGTSIPKFQEGGDTPKASTYDPKKVQEIEELYRKAKDKGTGKSKEALDLQQKFHEYFPEIAKEIILKGSGVTRKGQKAGYKTIEDLSKADDKTILNTNLDEYMGPRTEQYMAALAKLQRPRSEDLPVPNVTTTGNNNNDKGDDAIYDVRAKKRNPWIDLAGQALDYLRPSDQEALNPNQLMGELYAMSSNQLEPVQATPYSPQLRVPYDISFQDQINEITADQRGAQRMMGYNPAAQSNLAAQSYGAKSRVLADQFRANQAMKDQVYSSNIATLNDAQLKNLAIYDQQYQRQEQAKSNTKAVAQEALNSISSKYAQNALENRTLGVYENLYNYRYDKSGRAINMNAPYQANIPTVYSPAGEPNMIPVKDSDGNIIEYRRINEKRPSMAGTPINNAPEGKRGINVKKAMNGSIVKMLK
jgi:SHS2 domain-containing protein